MTKLQKYKSKADVVAKALIKLKPDRIIFFGSAVHGTPTKNSDIDICLIKAGNPLEIKKKAWKALRRNQYDWEIEPDIHVYSSQKFSDYLTRGDPFVSEISHGKVVYDQQIR